MTDTLARICADKRVHIARKKAEISESALRERSAAQPPPRGFYARLKTGCAAGRPSEPSAPPHCGGSIPEQRAYTDISLICEIKKASPSRGVIRKDFDPAALARAYEAGGAACLSVLTDEPYFQGADHYLAEARDACDLPVLRKDFMLDPYQVTEARALGADAILLIMAALSDAQARELEEAAVALGMDALVEVHDEAELERASSVLSSPLIGVNNRDLKTLKVDLATSERLASRMPQRVLRVCESGIATASDIARMGQAGYHVFLVGESLMRQEDVTRATRALLSPQYAERNPYS
jgi:indole-3-glycerol phosphate synthase